MEYELGRILLDGRTISARVAEMAAEVSEAYSGKEFVAVGVLKGAIFFLSDLVRFFPRNSLVRLDFMAVSSYGASTKSSGIVKIVKDLDTDIRGRDVLLVEDILDTGLTLSYLLDLLKGRSPRSLKTCVLLDKPDRRKVDVRVDFRGFQIPDEFVVGYGLDYSGYWRNLPDIHVVNPIEAPARNIQPKE
ncbi:MAG: hypoxanthine phosphoribosyltransferase [Synergistaceae bacterium]|jgi:hypoxanthine phosphoribosyltransferase|nr:hypoxanthine phosphoribosyltransferase [Synergistaceae bacterium]